MNPMLILASHSILDASKGVDFGQFIQAILSVICLLIDSVVYYVVSIAFKLFLAISQFQIFSDSAFNDLINRTYVVIGVISLFLVAYALLNAIIDPDNASKGDKSASKIVKNIIIAIIGIAIVPTVFNWFYEFQSRVLCNNTIPKLLLNKVDSDGSTVENTATQFAAYLFESFFYPNSTSSVDGDAVDKSTALKDVKLNIEDPIPATERNFDVTEYTLDVAYKHAEEGKSFFRVFSPFIFGNWFDHSIVDNTVQYLVILSTIAGGYCAYVLISLCIDMGLRAVKLGYLELIAPLAIMTKIVPGKDSVFKNWSKKTVSCALEVFVRLFVVVFVIYLINTIKDIELVSFGSKICGLKIGWFLVGILRALIYTSLFAFIKKAPKLFSEATGIKSDGFKIGLMDKMKENGMIQGLGALGGGITAGVRNMAPGVAKGFATGGVLGAIGGGIKSLPSGLAGAASGTRRGWSNTKDVKKWSDVKEGAGKAADEAMEAKLKRQDYKDAHGGTTIGAINGHVQDVKDAIQDYPNSHRANYNYENKKHQSMDNIIKADSAIDDKAKSLRDKYSDDMTFNGQKLSKIRKDEESINSTLQGLNQERARIIATGGDTRAIDAEIVNYQEKSVAAHKETIKAEKEINKEIKKGTYDNLFNSKELGDLNNLFIDYHTALKDNISSLSGDMALHDYASQILKQTATPEDFRAVINESTVKEYGNPSNTIKINFADKVKEEDTNVVRKMNQEGSAARKQQESKK